MPDIPNYMDRTSAPESSSILFGVLNHKLPINASRQIIPNTFHVRYGPKGHDAGGFESSAPANSLHKNPAIKGEKVRENDAKP